MKKSVIYCLLVYTIVIFSSPIFPLKAYAAGASYGGAECVPVYGGGEQCPRVGQFLIDKKVKNPASGVYVDNLGLSDPKYRPEQIVSFHITVKNAGDNIIEEINVTDNIPENLDFMSGPGDYNSDERRLTFAVSNLESGSSETFEVLARVVHQAVLPEDEQIICPVNVIDANTNDDSVNDHDESQFCIEKEFIVESVPQAGPENWISTAGILFSSLVLGYFFRLKATV